MSPVPSIELAPPRGMRDFYPEQTALRDALFGFWMRAARSFGFLRYDACVVESLGLLTRKAGEEIVDQIYAFRDKSQRDLALRPEMTPTLARMVAARWNALSFPLKWFAIAQCFRYERSSRGRKREHYQWNLDILGAAGPIAEVEILATALQAIHAMGLGDAIRVHISNRALLADLLEKTGIPADQHEALFLVLDKRGKLSDQAIGDMLVEQGFNAASIERIFGLFAIDSMDAARNVLECTTPALNHTDAVFDGLTAYGYRDCICFDLSVVRGLNYYTGTVFEAFDRQRKFRAVFGGGRYDHLLEQLGSQPTPAVGLGFGDVVIMEIMQDLQRLPTVAPAADLLIGYMDPAQADVARRAAMTFRRQGLAVDLAMGEEKAKTFFSRANRCDASQAIYLGPDDIATGHLRIKNLVTREETSLPLTDLGGDSA